MERMLLSERPHILSRGKITPFTPYGQNYNIYSPGTALSHSLPCQWLATIASPVESSKTLLTFQVTLKELKIKRSLLRM